MCDNTTATYCITKMGTSHSMDCHYLTIRIWEWAIKSNIQLTSALMPGKQSIIADRETRVCHVDFEWMLSLRYLHQSLNLLSFKPDIDFFVTAVYFAALSDNLFKFEAKKFPPFPCLTIFDNF